ncbi:MAG TPA: SpoIIE family protein phosphatase [Candidatus Binatia bacterium]|nr:SpoIIE family protein phosphatase [Candidatus Binatia bacterium]
MKVEKPDWLEQMEGILETLNEGVLIADDCQRILFVNECMERLIGRPRSAILGKTPEVFYQGKDLERLQEERARGLATGSNRYEYFLPRPDGQRVPVVVSARAIEDPDGRIFAVVTFTDITEQKKAEQNLRDANVQLELRAEEIDRELVLASRVQQSLAPQALTWGGVEVETYYMPVRTIGGDFGLVVPHGNSHLDLLICDVSGHGISSALLANRIYTETLSMLRRGIHLGELLRKLNKFVVQQIGISGFMFTMAAARMDEGGRKLTFAAAGHPPALLISASGELRHLEPRSTVLGAIEDAVPVDATDEFDLSAGDRLMLYSDGLTEVWNREEEMLGIEGLGEIARRAAVLPLPAMREAIIQGVTSYSADPVHDDVSLVLVEVQ